MERDRNSLAAVMAASRSCSAAEHDAKSLVRATVEVERLAAAGRLQQRLAECQDNLAAALRLLGAPPDKSSPRRRWHGGEGEFEEYGLRA